MKVASLAVVLAAGAVAPAFGAQKAITHVRSVLPFDGKVLSWEFADADGDGWRDLFVMIADTAGGRALQVYRLRGDGALPAEPDHKLDVKSDVVAWSLGEFTPEEAGAELLLLTRNAAFVLSPRQSSYRGLRKLSAAPMLLDLAYERSLPFWPAVADLDGDGRSDVALAVWDGYRLVSGSGEVLGEIPFALTRGRRPAAERVYKVGPVKVGSQPLADLFVPDEDLGILDPPPMLYAEEDLPLPFLADADGDGRGDLILADGGVIQVYRQRPRLEDGGLPFPDQPDSSLPFGGAEGWEIKALRLLSFGGGPAVDLVVVRSDAGGGLTGDWEFLLFTDPFAGKDGLRNPVSLLTTEASYASLFFTNLGSGPGRDLCVNSWSLELNPLGLHVDVSHAVSGYLAEGAGGHQGRAHFRYERSYSADDFTAFSLVPALAADLTGDGLTDLVESDATGALEVRPLQAPAGRPGFAAEAAVRIPVNALSSQVEVQDLDGDGLGDFVVFHQSTLEVLVARRR